MNRRGFLKRCSLIPFVGSLAAVGKAGTSEGQRRSGTRLVTEAEKNKLCRWIKIDDWNEYRRNSSSSHNEAISDAFSNDKIFSCYSSSSSGHRVLIDLARLTDGNIFLAITPFPTLSNHTRFYKYKP